MKPGNRRIKESIALKRLNTKFGNYITLLKYQGIYGNSTLRCKRGHIWQQVLAETLKSPLGCPKCSIRANAKRRTNTHKEFLTKIQSFLIILGKYRGLTKRIKVQCHRCKHIWYPTANNVKKGQGCPICAKYREAYIFQRKRITLNTKRYIVQGFEPLAIKWLINQGYQECRIRVFSSRKVPIINYKIKSKSHKYFPDIRIGKHLFEVKCYHTLINFWPINQAKSLACLKQGYKYNFLLIARPTMQVYKLPSKISHMNQTQLKHYVHSLGIKR